MEIQNPKANGNVQMPQAVGLLLGGQQACLREEAGVHPQRAAGYWRSGVPSTGP